MNDIVVTPGASTEQVIQRLNEGRQVHRRGEQLMLTQADDPNRRWLTEDASYDVASTLNSRCVGMCRDVGLNAGGFLVGQHRDDAVYVEGMMTPQVLVDVFAPVREGVKFHQQERERLRHINGH